MIRLLASTYKRTGSLTVIAAMLWLGGVGCGVCCVTGAEANASISAPSCEARTTCNCCKGRKAKINVRVVETAINGENAQGCSLLGNCITGYTVRVRTSDAGITHSETPSTHLPFIEHGLPKSIFKSRPSLDHGDVYLRCCVLLI